MMPREDTVERRARSGEILHHDRERDTARDHGAGSSLVLLIGYRLAIYRKQVLGVIARTVKKAVRTRFSTRRG